MDEGKGSHLVNWEVVGHPVNQGGLEIDNLRVQIEFCCLSGFCVLPLSLNPCDIESL